MRRTNLRMNCSLFYIAYPRVKDPELLDLPPDANIEAIAALNLWSTNRTALVVQ